ncbi:hypothetical protein TRFO_02786 [Tritrichomonas foetus]|uniref:Uncharacterized protein n=1 Tax=Tritrichomonas foetus TaxID=1144522 RepID=A0A1J4KWE9_9EUKA|nr:hypothetical protein TRFO_02786 [Tritrichomonas foetus]|eukprot:OHT15482.1 hypothetical protein TRFO_02786 [Tritrichomonas foetus]
MSEKFITYLRQKNINLISFPDSDANTSLIGTLVMENHSKDDIRLELEFLSDKWNLNFLENEGVIKTLPLPLSKWSYHCTFIQIEPDILFFSNRSEQLVQIAMTIAIASKLTKVPYPTKSEADSILVATISDQSNSKIKTLYTEPLYVSDMKFVPLQKLLHIYSITKDSKIYSFAFLPYLNANQGKSLPPPPMFYPSALPDEVFPENSEDAIFQGIRALYKRIDDAQAELDVAAETPLELTKQKMLLDIERLQSQIELKKQALILGMNKKENDILEAAMRTVSPTGVISNRIDFHGSYALPGKDVAAQILKLVDTINT